MRVFAIVFALLYLNISVADEFTEKDRRYLIDLPKPTSENLRWLVPADAWRFNKAHLLKGKYFKVRSIESLKVYKTTKLEGVPSYILSDFIYNGNNDALCIKTSYKRKESKLADVLKCTHGSCEPLDLNGSESSLVKDNYVSSKLSDSNFLVDMEKYIVCSLDIDYTVKKYINNHYHKDDIYNYVTISTQVEYGKNHYLKTISIDKHKNYLEIMVNDSKYYVDIRECQKQPDYCKEVDITFSDYEKDWIRLKKHQEQKNLKIMNYLISKLKPCLDKRDVVCIKKFLPDPTKDDGLSDLFVGYKIPKLEVNDELIAELKTCIDYKNVLPHLYGSKGINKVCIFNNKDGVDAVTDTGMGVILINVTYPEAVRIADGITIYMNPKNYKY